MIHLLKFQWGALRPASAKATVEGTRRRLLPMAAARAVHISSPIFSSLKLNRWAWSYIFSGPSYRLRRHASSVQYSLHSVGAPLLQLELQQQRRNVVISASHCNVDRRGDDEGLGQEQHQQQKSNRPEREGEEDLPLDVSSLVQQVLEAAEGSPTEFSGSSFWASRREDVMSLLKGGKLSLSTAALLVVAFSKAGELTGPLATAVARRLCTAFRAAAKAGTGSLLLGEGGPPLDKALTLETGEADYRVHFADAATVLLAMKEGGLLHDPSAGVAARELQVELLLCVQPQWHSLTFMQLRRLFLLLGATAEPLGLDMAAAFELLTAAKRHLRKMQKTSRRLFEEGDARDTVALVWPLACVSAALQLPPPHNSSTNNAVQGSLYYSSNNEDMKLLHRDRDIVLQLVKAQVHRAVSSRLPCSPFDLALGYAGLERLGQHSSAEYVLAAFSTAAAGAGCEELCRLGRDIMLAGARQKALWEAFGAAVQAAVEQRQQTPPSKQHSSTSHRIEAELYQWLRFCGRTI